MDLRRQAAQYIRTHKEDFEPFMTDCILEDYCNEIENTARWGGEIEIIALARSLELRIELIQARGETLIFEGKREKVVRLARYQHMYSLGAHFNSLIPKTNNT